MENSINDLINKYQDRQKYCFDKWKKLGSFDEQGTLFFSEYRTLEKIIIDLKKINN